ncbi:MAG: LysM peptidoglycan-binding domain-containing protein [Chitinophagales bacterium]|nr:LysM peptidoglycan-binding domain-containing protein [Chitinophagales bacterium]MDW8427813.1 LysM peptidoglycan-binding domain-containing protein [Chitinophagales bacterium]
MKATIAKAFRHARSCWLKNAWAAMLFVVCPLSLQAQARYPSLEPFLFIPFSDGADSLNLVNDPSGISDLEAPRASFADVDVPVYSDSVYQLRLQLLQSEIPLDYNPQVRNYIDLYVLKRRDQVRRMLALSKFYYPLFDEIFASYGIPKEMKHLCIVESALNPHAVSRAGATGLWQFMYATAKVYGLQINQYIDERRDIIRATHGAAQYLSRMYDVYGDWLLAIASYNCGPHNVNRAIQRSGKNTFWEIQPFLPRETRGYVPAFIAATYVMNYYELHNLQPDYEALKFCYDSLATIPVENPIAFETVARYTGLTLEELRFLNPGVRSNIIPALNTPYELKLPSDRCTLFFQYRDSILAHSAHVKPVYYYGPAPGQVRTYTVRPGDNLSSIAARHRVTVAQLKRWNNLRSNLIHPGQRLKIYSGYQQEVAVQNHKPSTSSSGAPLATAKTSDESAEEPRIIYYKTRYGDTLWSIARRHGTTVEKIRALNGSKCDNLKAGTVLKIQTKT